MILEVSLYVRMAHKFPIFFFADDNLIFCRAKMGDMQAIQSIFFQYEKVSRQQVNGLETNLFFGKLIPDSTKNALKTL